MIPDNPDTACQTDLHDFPTPEACRAAARQTYAFSRGLRYDHDDALDRAADAVYALLPVPHDREEVYEDLLYQRDTYREAAHEAEEAIAEAEDTIRDLRTELAEANDRITELAKDYL